MRRRIAAWTAQAPADLRADSENMLARVAGLDPLSVLGFVFNHHHINPQLASKQMSQSYAIVEHLALLLAKAPAAGHELAISSATAKQLVDMLAKHLQKAIIPQPELPPDGSPPNDAFIGALFAIRSWELAVRVERYDHQQKALLRALFEPFATDLAAAIGFTCDDAMAVEDAYGRRIHSTVAESERQAHEALADVDRVLKGKPARDEGAAALVQDLRTANPGVDIRKQLIWMVLLWTALRTGHARAPDIDELVGETGLQREVVQHITDALSVTTAELDTYWYIVPVGPLKRHPLVTIAGRSALPSPGLFLPALQTLFEDVLKGTPRWEDYQKHRAAYSEDRAARLFARALSGATIYKNLKYKSAKGEGEVDVLVLFERQLFFVEVKSGDFADAARAGVESRVEDTLRDLVLKAFEQVTRAAEYLEGVPVATFRDGKTKVDIRRADLDDVHLVSLTMEQLGHVVNTAKAFIYAGQPKAPLSLSLDDLEVVTDILTLPSLFLHYVARREVYASCLNVEIGDELGFLETYLRDLLHDDPSKYGDFDHVMMDPSSKAIDDFEHARGAGEDVSPPKPAIPDQLRTLLENLADLRTPSWLAVSFVLLNLIARDQRRLARSLQAFIDGKRVDTARVTRSGDGTASAAFRIDDPRLAPGDSGGTVVVVNRELAVLSTST